ncbi:MAG: hypothetical protein K6T61_01585 [Bryobacteraceae bacterium]|nr:hypothetical protein [Bryobacteraceae bacterium]
MSEKKKSLLSAAGVALAVAAVALIPLAAFLVYRTVAVKPGVREDPAETVSIEQSAAAKAPHVFGGEEEAEEPPRPRLRTQAVLPASSPPQPRTIPATPLRSANPTPESVAPGMEKAKLIASYGKPQMITYGIENGQPVETYHYLKRDTGTEMIVRLRGGKVVSVGTTVY